MSARARENYRNGVRFFSWRKQLDYLIDRIDRAKDSDKNSFNASDHLTEQNGTGRVWSF